MTSPPTGLAFSPVHNSYDLDFSIRELVDLWTIQRALLAEDGRPSKAQTDGLRKRLQKIFAAVEGVDRGHESYQLNDY